ncbi:MAG: reverse transcriptase/maturase family protein [Patescibacteria group bacterium]
MRHKYNDTISVENLLHSWQEFLCGKKKRKDVAEFLLNFSDNIFDLRQELKNKTYKHGGYHAFKINDPKPRSIHKASVRDRLLHHVIYNALYPYFDRKFIFDSYSCRFGKGTHKAINRFREFGRKVSTNHTKTCWVLKCDIRKFFASINHNLLKDILDKNIKDPDIFWLLNQVIDSFNTENKVDVGLPLGNLTSQIFVNIYMDKFDQFMKREIKAKYYIRYADDFVILSENKNYLLKLIPKIASFLEEKLKLELHPNKLFVKTLSSGIDFLGWVHFPKYRVLRTSTKNRMFRRLAGEFKKETGASYSGLLSHGNGFKLGERIKLLQKQNLV